MVLVDGLLTLLITLLCGLPFWSPALHIAKCQHAPRLLPMSTLHDLAHTAAITLPRSPVTTNDFEQRQSIASEPVEVIRIRTKEDIPSVAIFNDTFRCLVESVRRDASDVTSSDHHSFPFALLAAAVTVSLSAAFTCVAIFTVVGKLRALLLTFFTTNENVAQKVNSRAKAFTHSRRSSLPVPIHKREVSLADLHAPADFVSGSEHGKFRRHTQSSSNKSSDETRGGNGEGIKARPRASTSCHGQFTATVSQTRT